MTPQEELKVENSRHITNVALVLLPGVIAIVSFVVDNRVVGKAFWSLSILAAASLAASLLAGGAGVSRLRRGLTSGVSLFNVQAWLCVLGFALLVCISLAVGAPKETDLDQRIDSLARQLGAHDERIKAATVQSGTEAEQVRLLRKEVSSLRRALEKVSRPPGRKDR